MSGVFSVFLRNKFLEKYNFMKHFLFNGFTFYKNKYMELYIRTICLNILSWKVVGMLMELCIRWRTHKV